MPIVYEAPQPFAPAISEAYGRTLQNNEDAPRLSRARELAAAASQNGFGNRSQGPYDTGIQDAIQFRDTMYDRRDQFNASQGPNARDVYQQTGAETMQRQRFELQAQLHDTELSQSERMRLQRLKNSIGEITSDPTLTDEEKKEYISQIKYNISPLQQRLAQEKLQMDQMVKNSMVDDLNARAKLKEDHAKLNAMTFEDRKFYDVPPEVMAEIIADINKNGGSPLNPKEIEDMARKEAMRQGLGTMMYQHKPGEWIALEKAESAGKASSSSAAGKNASGSNHPTGLSASEFRKELNDIDKIVHGEQSQKNDEGTFVNPQSVDWANERRRQLREERGVPASFAEYQKMQPAPEKSGYKSRFKPKEDVALAAAATPKAIGDILHDFDIKDDFISKAEGVTGEEKKVVSKLMERGKKIVMDYPDHKARPKHLQEELEALGRQYEGIKKKVKEPASAQPEQQPEQKSMSWWQKFHRGDIGRDVFDINKAKEALDSGNVGGTKSILDIPKVADAITGIPSKVANSEEVKNLLGIIKNIR